MLHGVDRAAAVEMSDGGWWSDDDEAAKSAQYDVPAHDCAAYAWLRRHPASESLEKAPTAPSTTT